jgi:hypothetical protein
MESFLNVLSLNKLFLFSYFFIFWDRGGGKHDTA